MRRILQNGAGQEQGRVGQRRIPQTIVGGDIPNDRHRRRQRGDYVSGLIQLRDEPIRDELGSADIAALSKPRMHARGL